MGATPPTRKLPKPTGRLESAWQCPMPSLFLHVLQFSKLFNILSVFMRFQRDTGGTPEEPRRAAAEGHGIWTHPHTRSKFRAHSFAPTKRTTRTRNTISKFFSITFSQPSICLLDMVVSHLFEAEIKGSEQPAARSGVLLAVARPQPPPEVKKKDLVPDSACCPCPACGWPFCRLFLGYVAFRSDPCPIVPPRAPTNGIVP